MNKHFEDARYYVNRAAETAKKGIEEELEPVQDRVRELTNREEEPDPSRLETIRNEVADVEERAEGEARRALHSARSRIDEYRRSD